MHHIKDLPVLILGYNRYDKFIRCISSLQAQGIKRIYVSIDGPKNDYDKKIQRKISNFCFKNSSDLNINYKNLNKNFGCRNGPIKGITWFFKENKYGVILEDDVELGASCTIDRGVTGDTIIGKGTKIDNQVHVGHDTYIGKKCLIAAQTGIAGCNVIEGNVTRNRPVRVLRDDVVIFEGELDSLRRFKDDVNEVKNGNECGMGIKNYKDVKPGDKIEVYERREESQSI